MSLSMFTFAEMEALLHTDPNWPAARTSIGLDYEPTEQIVAAGVTSLVARDLARIDGDALIVSPVAEEPIRTLVAKGVDVSIGLYLDGQLGLSSFRVLSETRACLITSFIMAGLFDIRIHEPHERPAELLQDITMQLLSRDAAVALGCGDTVLQIQRTNGSWGIRSYGEADFTPVGADTVKHRIVDAFASSLNYPS